VIGIEIMQPDKALIAILLKREHSRLASQVKALEKMLEKPVRCQLCRVRLVW
jgi:hypothetical protein